MANHLLLPWNIVARNFSPREELKYWVQREIRKLERHLAKFPHESVHLHVDFEYHKKTRKFTANLTLRLPSNLLNSKATDEDPISALAEATKALIREVEKLKDDLRHVKDWRRLRRGAIKTMEKSALAQSEVAFSPEPLPQDKAPEDISDLLKQVIEENYPRLLDYIKRQIDYFENAGEVPKNSIDAEAALDEVVKEVLKNPEEKPDEIGYIQWIYQKINDELNKRYRILRAGRKAVPVDEIEEEVESSNSITPLMVSMLNEPPEEEFSRKPKLFVPSRILPPDQELAEREFIDELMENARSWEKTERDVFELHFIEGFSVEDCAMILKLNQSELRKIISSVHERIRQKILEEIWTK